MTELVNVGGGAQWAESFTGGGPAESMAQLVNSIENDAAFSVAANGAVLGLDALGAMADPLETIAGSAIGWLLEHVGFLNDFLDYTAGDPVAVDEAVAELYKAAKELDTLAAEHITSLSKDVPTYGEGGSASFNAFLDRGMPRAEQIRTQSLACRGLGSAMAVDGGIVATVRGVIREILVEFVYWLLKTGAAALAAAPYTFGGSLAALAGDSAIQAARTARTIAGKLEDVASRLTAMSGKLGSLATTVEHANKAVKTTASNVLLGGARAADTLESRPELGEADRAAARREEAQPPPEPTRPGPWHTRGTLDE